MATLIIAITGASGAVYAQSMLRALGELGHDVYFTVTEPGCRVLREELLWAGLPSPDDPDFIQSVKQNLDWPGRSDLTYFDYRDIGAPIASGSVITGGMVIVPCSMSTLSAIAVGASDNLVQRAADVMLKERRPLVVVPREAPLSQVHLKNMLALAQMGVHIVPAAPAFYHRPKNIDDLAAFITGKVLDLLNIGHNLFRRWGD